MQRKSLFINGSWREGSGGRIAKVFDPSTEEEVGVVSFVEREDLDAAAAAAGNAFKGWAAMPAMERAKLLRHASSNMRSRSEQIATAITREQGKPISDARLEVSGSADQIDWFADEGRRAYGRIVPSRSPEVIQMVLKEPIGPVAAFSPWNFPVYQLVRKVAPALAAGCSIVAKAPEETPLCAIETIRCFEDAGIPAGVINLVFGVPSEISEHLIASPHIRKISFTGSVAVGRHLGVLCAREMKRTTMELGGHAPFIVTAKADLEAASRVALAMKFKNAGQVCVSPTRFLIDNTQYGRFIDLFVAGIDKVVVGPANDPKTTMGPLAHAGRLAAMETLVEDAVKRGAELLAGGHRVGNRGYFFAPTILANVPPDAMLMKEEPFGPIAIVNPVKDIQEAIFEANRLPFGLCSFAFTTDLAEADLLGRSIQAGAVAINQAFAGLPEIPFGGVKDSGHGSEGGIEGLQAFLVDKVITQRSAAA
jgi:succinate-semialdehyde dehydrogenase/glutarate-semialdehyde dehydrogenase